MTVSAHSKPLVEAPTPQPDAPTDTDTTESTEGAASPGSPSRFADAPLSTRAWFPVAGSMIAVAWGGNEFTPLLVMYRETSNFSQVTVNGLLAAYVVGIIPALLIGGPLSDLLGRRPLLLPAAPLSLAGSFLLSVAPQRTTHHRAGTRLVRYGIRPSHGGGLNVDYGAHHARRRRPSVRRS